MNDNPWIETTATVDLPEGEAVGVQIAGRPVALYHVGDAVYATDDQCTHAQVPLSGGFVEGHEIECPLHQGRFDVRTGAPTAAPACEALRCHEVRVEGVRVYVRLAGELTQSG